MNNKTFSPLVCNQKGEKWKREIETHFRLPQAKSLFQSTKVQVGPLEKYIPFPQKRNVGGENRPKACIFSPAIGRKFKAFPTDGSSRGYLSALCSWLRSKLIYLWMDLMKVFQNI